MKLLIISDIHGSSYYAEKIKEIEQRENRIYIKDRRNDVMHYHKITEDIFDSTRGLMKMVNDEIGQYLDRVRDDISYPKAKAGDAKMAAKMISESYADMLEGVRSSPCHICRRRRRRVRRGPRR